jgi:hypothetical protein
MLDADYAGLGPARQEGSVRGNSPFELLVSWPGGSPLANQGLSVHGLVPVKPFSLKMAKRGRRVQRKNPARKPNTSGTCLLF